MDRMVVVLSTNVASSVMAGSISIVPWTLEYAESLVASISAAKYGMYFCRSRVSLAVMGLSFIVYSHRGQTYTGVALPSQVGLPSLHVKGVHEILPESNELNCQLIGA